MEASGAWFGPTINSIISPFYNHFAKYALYCFTAGSNVRDHRIGTDALKLKRAGVEEMIQADGHSLDAVQTEQARLWLEQANPAVSKEGANRLRYTQRYRLWGCCSLNFLENYKISKLAKEELGGVQSLIRSAPGDNNITRAPGPRRVESMLLDPAQMPPSRWIILRGALQFIVSNDPSEGMVGMWGPDKDDSTNLLKHINNSFLEQSLFDYVIFVPSSSDVLNIQSEIIRRLCMNQDGNEATRATRIREQLQNKNFLVIVDDLRQNLDLRAVGIPYPLGVGEQKRKVVITSLSGYRSVGNLMGVNRDIELPILQEGEARELFRQSINYQGDLYSDPDIGAHATDLVRAINGLPSELVRYGKAMRRTTDASSWKVAIDEAARKFSRSPLIESTLRLIEDDPALGVIGIWGPGGVGKTYLLEKIKDSFRGKLTVICVTASRECSVLKVQTKILEVLKLTGDGKVETQSDTIRSFLENKSFLLLLDDLWETIDLKAVGIPHPLGIEPLSKLKRKVVLATRLTGVCGGMQVRKKIQVLYLQKNEAWELFRENVGDETLRSPTIQNLARELVDEMKGLPLALITVGKAMDGKTIPEQWDSAIQHMKKSCCIDTNEDPLQMEEEVFRKIMFGYDNLKSERLKKCFLSCALWPEDANIHRRELAHCWVGLGLVDEQDMQKSYTTAYSLMGDLAGACLLEWSGPSSVKLHDVIRDMSLWVSCGCGKNNGKWSVRAGVGSDEKFSIPWSTVEYISLMSNEMTKIPSVGNPLNLFFGEGGYTPVDPPNLRVLCLQINMLDEFTISGLLVNSAKLTYLDLRGNDLKGIPECLCRLAELIHLDLSYNIDIEEVPDSFGNLVKLKFLYLQCTGITIIPEEVISGLKELEIIHLGTGRKYWLCDIQSNVYGLLGTLNHLKAVGTSARLFDARSSLRDATDLPIWSLRLGASVDIEGCMEKEFRLNDMLSFGFARKTLYELDIVHNDHVTDITLGQTPGEQPCSFGILSDLHMHNLPALTTVKWMGSSRKSLFPMLTSLILSYCTKLEHLSWTMYLPRLERLNVYHSFTMQRAFTRYPEDNEWSGHESSQTFRCLKYLVLSDCKSLVNIGEPDVTFPSLELLRITDCPELKRLPFEKDDVTSSGLPPNLQFLEMDNARSWARLELEEGVKSFLEPRLQYLVYKKVLPLSSRIY